MFKNYIFSNQSQCLSKLVAFNKMKKEIKIDMIDPNQTYDKLPNLTPSEYVETKKALLEPAQYK